MHTPEVYLAVDAVVFAYTDGQLHVLLIEQRHGPLAGQRALPGGFVRAGEGLREAVERELIEETGLRVDYLEQLYTYGDDTQRDPRAQVVTVAYYALVPPDRVASAPEGDARDAAWTPIAELPALAFDHATIIRDAAARLRAKLSYQPIGFELLPERFPFSALEDLYETLLDRPIDRRNFRRKMLSFNVLAEAGPLEKSGPGRPGMAYRFDKTRYEQLQREGFLFDIK